MDGPRGATPDEVPALIELLDAVFRPGSDRSMRDDFPHIYAPGNAVNCRVMLDGDQVVSAANLVFSHAILAESRVAVASLGGVCTHPDYRGRGLASDVVDDCIAHALANRADLLLVSGYRGLYYRRHCVRVGRWWQHELSGPGKNSPSRSWQVRVLQDREIVQAATLYRREPVRFIRRPEDWQRFLRDGVCDNRPSQIYGIWTGDLLGAYAIVSEPDPEGRRWVGEYAGDRWAIADGLTRLAVSAPIAIRVPDWDAVGRSAFARAGGEGTASPWPGTARVLRPGSLFGKLESYFGEVLGPGPAAAVKAEDHADTVTLSYARHRSEIPRATATLLLLGAPDDVRDELQELPPALAGFLRTVFPLPLPWPGLNYA